MSDEYKPELLNTHHFLLSTFPVSLHKLSRLHLETNLEQW